MDTAHSFDPPAHCSETQKDRNTRKPAITLPAASPPPPPCPVPKAGFTAFEPGSSVVFALPLSASSFNRESHDGRSEQPLVPPAAIGWHGRSWTATLAITYLSSYEGMGIATVSCGHECSCAGARIDAHRKRDFLSLWSQHHTEVLVNGIRATSCEVRLTIQNRSIGAAVSAAGNKFKLGSMVLMWSSEDEKTANGRSEAAGPKCGLGK